MERKFVRKDEQINLIMECRQSGCICQPIQEAQSRLCEDSDNCIMISELAGSFVENGYMKDNYHYTQEGYNLLGEDAGKKQPNIRIKK